MSPLLPSRWLTDGPLERSRAPLRRAVVRNLLVLLAPWALILLAVCYWRG